MVERNTHLLAIFSLALVIFSLFFIIHSSSDLTGHAVIQTKLKILPATSSDKSNSVNIENKTIINQSDNHNIHLYANSTNYPCPTWDCSDWYPCQDKTKSRICYDLSGCKNSKIEVEECDVISSQTKDKIISVNKTNSEEEKLPSEELPSSFTCSSLMFVNLLLSLLVLIVILFIFYNEINITNKKAALLKQPLKYSKHMFISVLLAILGFIYFIYSIKLHFNACTNLQEVDYSILIWTLVLIFIALIVFILIKAIYLFKPSLEAIFKYR